MNASSSRPPVFGGATRSTATASTGNPFTSTALANSWQRSSSAAMFGGSGSHGNSFAQPANGQLDVARGFGVFGTATGPAGANPVPAPTPAFGRPRIQFGAGSFANASATSASGSANRLGFSSNGAAVAATAVGQPSTGWFPLGDVTTTRKPSPFSTPLSGTSRPFETANPFVASNASGSVAAKLQAFRSFGFDASNGTGVSPFAPKAPASTNPFAAGNGDSANSSAQKNATNYFPVASTGSSASNPFGFRVFASATDQIAGGADAWRFHVGPPSRGTPAVDGTTSSSSAGFRFTFAPSWQPNAELSAERSTSPPQQQQQKVFSSCFAFPKAASSVNLPRFVFKTEPDWNATSTSTNTASGSAAPTATAPTGFDVRLTNPTTSSDQEPKSLVALPDANPYGADSLEVAVKAALSFEHAAGENHFLSLKPKPKLSANHANLGLPTRPLHCAALKSNRRMVGGCSSLRAASIRRTVGSRGFRGGASAACGERRAPDEIQSEFSLKSSLFRDRGSRQQLGEVVEGTKQGVEEEVNRHSSYSNGDDQQQQQSVHSERASEDSEVAGKAPPVNPACPVLTNPEISTVPELSQLQRMSSEDLAQVDGFAIRSAEFGEIEWSGVTDVRHLNLDEILLFSDSEVVVYPDERASKPAVGQGLNKRAVLRLSHIYPSETNRKSADDEDAVMAFVERLKKRTADLRAQFLGYEATGGIWTFEVEHF